MTQIVAFKQQNEIWRKYAKETLNQHGGSPSPVDRYVNALPYEIQIHGKVQTFIDWARQTADANRYLNQKVADLEAYIEAMRTELRTLQRTTIYPKSPQQVTEQWVDVKTYAKVWGKSPSRVYDYIRQDKVDYQKPPEGKNGYRVNVDVAPRLGRQKKSP